LATVTDAAVDELLALARKSAPPALEEKFLEAFAADPGRLDVYLRIAEEMKATGKKEKAGTLLTLTLEHYEKSGTPEQRVKLLSFVASALEKERTYRQQLARALQDLHGERRGFELFLDASGLKGDVPVEAAIARLERMFQYDVGRFVLHGSGWGVGLVDGVDLMARELLILFEGQRRHSMPVQSAVDTLTPLSDADWRVLKHFKTDELKFLCERDPGEVLARMLQQMGRPVDVATVRGHLEGAVIPASQWSRWWSNARKSALQRPDVEIQGNRILYRKTSTEDRLGAMRRVLSARQVLDLVTTLLKSTTERGVPDPKLPALMESLLPVLCEGATKHAQPEDPAPLELLLLADEIAEQHHLTRLVVDERLAAAMRDESGFFRRLSELGNAKLEKRALDRLKEFSKAEYGDKLLALARVASSRLLDQIAPELIDAGRAAPLKSLLNEAMRRPEAQPELLVFARRRVGQPRFAALLGDLDAKAIVERCLAMGEQQGRKVDPVLRGLQRQVAKELTDGNGKEFRQLVKGLSLDNARLLMRRIEMLRGLTDHAKLIMLQVFGEVHPELAKKEEETEAHLDENVVYCTEAGIRRRNDDYEKLVNVELPKIFAAIGKAAAFGDLSENAEYTAALEERARMTKRAEEMVDELRRAKPIDASLLEEGVVTIGSQVRVKDVESGQERSFTFLGPWDTDLEKGRLDYRAPLARAFMGHGVGDAVRAELGGKAAEFEILEIRPALPA
jgi:transcription elongation factor GreA